MTRVKYVAKRGVPDNAVIKLYADYSYQVASHDYGVNVTGRLSEPGKRNAKNRALMTSLKKLLSGRGNQTLSDLESGRSASEFDASSYSERYSESESDFGTNTGTGTESSYTTYQSDASYVSNAITQADANSFWWARNEDYNGDRLGWWIDSPIRDEKLMVKVSLEPDADGHKHKHVKSWAHTGRDGVFHVVVRSRFPPRKVVVKCSSNESVVSVITVSPIPQKGLSIISDVDDTVRHTGMLDGTLEAVRNILWRTPGETKLSGVARWYREMNAEFQCPVHYVSNGPWRFYNSVEGFLTSAEFPVTSVHLRDCTGSLRNILQRYTEPHARHKRETIGGILQDFPLRKFVLIGDSGGGDLELYSSIANTYPYQIVAIYLRGIPKSFTSRTGQNQEQRGLRNARELQKYLDSREDADEYLSDSSATVSSSSSRENSDSGAHYQYLPTPQHSPSHHGHPPLDQRPTAVRTSDKRYANWLNRVEQVMNQVPSRVPIKIWFAPSDVKQDCWELMQEWTRTFREVRGLV